MQNINEELKRMLYLTQHIRGVVISEQIDLVGPKKSVNVNTPIGGGGVTYRAGKESEKTLNTQTNTLSYVYRHNKTPGPVLEKQVDEVLKSSDIVDDTLSGEEQLSLWGEIKTNDRYFAADVVRFIQTHKNVKQTILGKKGDEQKVPEIVDETPDIIDNYPGYEITTPASVDTTKYFADNQWVLSKEGIQDIENNFITPIITASQGNENTGKSKKICINYINIDTSASRFRNKGQALNMTFSQLSELRNNATYEYLLKRLKEIGATEWCSTEGFGTRNFSGQNGDGTSGPNPPYKNKEGSPYYYVPKNKTSADAVTDNSKTRYEFGQPLSDKSEYEQFKYNRIGLGVAFKFDGFSDEITKSGGTDQTIPTNLVSNEYTAKFIVKTKGRFSFNWRWKSLKFPKPPSGRPSGSNPVACPKWGSPKVGGKTINF